MQRILINGAWVEAWSAAGREIKNPATLEPLGFVPDCGAEDVRRAVAAALAAQPDWSNISGAEKGTLLEEIGERIRARAEALAALMTLETGTPLCESIDSVGGAAACFEHHGKAARGNHDRLARVAAPPRFANGNDSIGVVAALTPCNLPLLEMAKTVAPAIAAGNTVICQPPQHNPLAILKLAEILELLPPGVINVVTGGGDIGPALVHDPDVDLVVFTGSPSAGRQLAATAGKGREKLALELGSPDPVIVLEDADLEVAVPGAAWTRLRHCGQRCASGKRVYVDRSIAAEFADRIHEYVAFLEVGDPMKPETDLGPLIAHEAARRVEEQVAHAAKGGARLKLGGRCFRPWGLPGHFFQPTILTEVRPGSLATQEDIFGPVLLITPVAGAAEALRFASDYGAGQSGRYGLSGTIYTRTSAAARLATESLQAGTFEHITSRRPCWFPYRDRKLPRPPDRRDHGTGA
jgi:acyl-CoA reductase-like NAD-dependent aldehyde dehydrogenase